MSHLQFPKLLTHPRMLWDFAIWHPQHHHDSSLSVCRQQTRPPCHGFRAKALRVVNLVCPPRCRQPSHNSPADYFLSTCCDVGPHLSALSLQSPWYAKHNFITPLRGGLHHRCSGEGHLSGVVLKVLPKVSVAVSPVRARVISVTLQQHF